jgi:hypothetical protein
VYLEFEFDEALVVGRIAGRDRLAPDGSKTVAQEFGEGLPEIGERQHAGGVLINRDDQKYSVHPTIAYDSSSSSLSSVCEPSCCIFRSASVMSSSSSQTSRLT